MNRQLLTNIFYGVCILLCVALFVAYFVYEYVTNRNEDKEAFANICQTKECINTASHILKSMDESVNPCDNFYKFSCGNFERDAIFPTNKVVLDKVETISDKVVEQMHRMIAEPITPNEPKVFRLAKDLFQSCMNTSAIEKKGLEPLYKIIEKLGGSPMLMGDLWNGTKFDWIDTMHLFQENGYSDGYLLYINVGTNIKNRTKRIIYINQPSLALPREYFFRDKGLEEPEVLAYKKYQIKIAKLLGADPTRSEKEITAVLEFERKLANISLSTEEEANMTLMYNPMTIGDVQKRWKSIQWLKSINKCLPQPVHVDENELVVVQSPKFLDGLEKLLSETSKRTQANYAVWRAVENYLKLLNNKIRDIQLEFYSTMIGVAEREPRWKQCTIMTGSGLGTAVGAMYIRHYFKKESKQNAVDMWQDIQNTLVEMLKDVDWMDPKTKERALNKAAAMKSIIGYHSGLLNDSIVEELYDGLEMNAQDYSQNMLNLAKHIVNGKNKRLRETVKRPDLRIHGMPNDVNALYDTAENLVDFPAAILQDIFYDVNRPKYLNYGAIGVIMGHELTHGFDDLGAQYDLDGNWNNWWEPKTKDAFLEKTKCMIEQYGKYNVTEIGLLLNGNLTLSENIADNGGAKISYRAYQNWVKRNQPEPTLPGLQKYTSNQLFWINSASTRCSKMRLEAMRLMVVTGEHSPDEFRITGTFSNMESFAKDFNCPVGSNMNPVKKCNVW